MKFSDFFTRNRSPITKQVGFSVAKKDQDGGKSAPSNLIKIFTGEDDNYNLASGSVNKQITTASRLCGVPVITTEGYEWLQNIINDEAEIIHKMALVNGTHWAVPRVKGKGVVIEHIRDDEIGNNGLRVNRETGELEAIYQRLHMTIPEGEYSPVVKTVTMQRGWTRKKIYTKWSDQPATEEDNLDGILPTPFSFASTGDIRGISAYAGQLRIIKALHDLRFNQNSILSRAKPKLSITSDDINAYVKDNMVSNGQSSKFDPYASDVIINKEGERGEWLTFPSSVFADINTAIVDLQEELLTSGLLPEMFSGRALTGNYASAEYNVIQGVEFINSMRREFNKEWGELLNNMVKRWRMQDSTKRSYIPVEFTWDVFNMISPVNKAQVLTSIAGAVATLDQARLPQSLIFDMVKELNPRIPYKNYAELKEEMLQVKTEFTEPETWDFFNDK